MVEYMSADVAKLDRDATFLAQIKDPRVALTTEGLTEPNRRLDMTYLSAFYPSPLYTRKENYLRYLDSSQWAARKRAYWLSPRPQFCWVCDKPWTLKESKFNFHHITYENVFNEPLEDLVLLCSDHHSDLEQQWKETPRNIGVDLIQHTKMYILLGRNALGKDVNSKKHILVKKYLRGDLD
jgi:hypothetical protein